MLAEKKSKPLEVCSVCHALSDRREDLNHRCSTTVHGRRCSGTYKSSMAYTWDQCESCQATGKVGTQACPECSGFGWKMYG
jgi:hypothetical protein